MARGWRQFAVDLTPLRRHRDFRLLMVSRGITFLGSMVTYVAIPVQVFALTRSSFAVGLLGTVELACLLVPAFLGGALADAFDRRRLVLLAEAVFAICVALLAVNASSDRPRVWVVFVLAGALAALDALQRPALDALIARLVDPPELTAASAIGSLEGTIAMIVGPAVAGAFIAGPGLTAAFVFDGVTFGVSLAVLAAMGAAPPPPDAEKPSLRRVVEGLRYARSRQELIGTYAVDMAAMFFGMPSALYPAMAARLGGAAAVGLLYAAAPVGAFLASATSGWTSRVHRHGVAVATAAAAWGAAIVAFGLAPRLWLAVGALMVAGGADMLSGVFRMTMWNRTIPDSLRGRLASIELLSYSSGPSLGNTEAGAAAALIGVRGAVVSGGVLCVAAVAVTTFLLPRFRSYDDRDTPRNATPAPLA